MRLLRILVTLCLTICVNTFADAGAYERVLYYYAYKLDCAVNGHPKTIASSCGPNCSFNRFIMRTGRLLREPNITQEEFPDVDRVAGILRRHGITGKYIAGRIVNGSSNQDDPGSNISHVLDTVADSVETNLNITSNPMFKKSIARAAKRVLFYRELSTSKKLEQEMPGKLNCSIQWQYTTKTMMDTTGRRETCNFIDIPGTAYSLRGTRLSNITREINVSGLNHGGHRANIDACRNILRAVSGMLKAHRNKKATVSKSRDERQL